MSRLSKFIFHNFPSATGRIRLKKELKKHTGISVTVQLSQGLHYDFILTKKAGHIIVTCDVLAMGKDQRLSSTLFSRLGAALYCFAQTNERVKQCRGDISDGNAYCAGLLSFSSPDPRAILIPDSDFVHTKGYQTLREFILLNRKSWAERRNVVLWRGSTTGAGKIAFQKMDYRSSELIQRTQVCLLLNNVNGTDVKFSSLVQQQGEYEEQLLREAGLLADSIPSVNWLDYRFAIDVDGNTNAWANLFQRLLFGCCVLKVSSRHNFQQWYYKDLVPWVHFIPVKADLSDMREIVSWCLANADACEKIAEAGAALAWKMTLETEVARGAANIEAALLAG